MMNSGMDMVRASRGWIGWCNWQDDSQIFISLVRVVIPTETKKLKSVILLRIKNFSNSN